MDNPIYILKDEVEEPMEDQLKSPKIQLAEETDVIDKFVIDDNDSEMDDMTPIVESRRQTLKGNK